MIDFNDGIVNTGDWTLLKKVFQRGRAGEVIRIGFIGGSITQGSLSTTPKTCYAYLVYDWWKSLFPNAEYINAGIGGTSSQFGAARVEDDMLRYSPDVVFVEFSVNDESNELYQETYEGLVRKILKTGAAVVLIHNVQYDTMISAENIHLAIGKHYNLPCVSMKSTICPEITSGRIEKRLITPDDLHPNDYGHSLVAKCVINLLNQIAAASDTQVIKYGLPEPMTANHYENAERYQNTNSNPALKGFVPDYSKQESITQMFKKGYTSSNVGDSIVFELEASEIAVQYRKSINQPTPIAHAIIDDDSENPIILDGNFKETWGDCLFLETLLYHGERKKHKIEIVITEAHDNDVVPFYLVSIIGSK